MSCDFFFELLAHLWLLGDFGDLAFALFIPLGFLPLLFFFFDLDGAAVGWAVGFVGRAVGLAVGLHVGIAVGIVVGGDVMDSVGAAV
jgi:hypothetical protein